MCCAWKTDCDAASDGFRLTGPLAALASGWIISAYVHPSCLPDTTHGTAIYANQLGWCQGGLSGAAVLYGSPRRVVSGCIHLLHPFCFAAIVGTPSPQRHAARGRPRAALQRCSFKQAAVSMRKMVKSQVSQTLPRLPGLPSSQDAQTKRVYLYIHHGRSSWITAEQDGFRCQFCGVRAAQEWPGG